MTSKERHEIYESYRALLKQAIQERAYYIAIKLKEAYRDNNYDELKRLVEYYK